MLALLASLMVMNLAERTNFSVAAPLIMKDLRLTNTDFGIVLSTFQWVYGLLTLGAGLAVDRYGPRLIMGWSALLWSLSAAATSFVSGLAALLGTRSLLGAAESPVFPSMVRVVSRWFPNAERGLATSICFTVFQLSTAVIVPIATVLMLAVGWRRMILVMGLVSLIPTALWYFFYRDPLHDRRLGEQERRYILENQVEAAPAPQISVSQWLNLFRHRLSWKLLVGGFSRQYVEGFNLWLPLYLAQAWALSIQEIGWVAALPPVGAAVGLLLGGRVSDILVRRGAEPLAARRRMVVVGALISACISTGLMLTGSYEVAIALLVVGAVAHGLGHASWWMMPSAATSSDRFTGSLASIQNFGGLIGMVIGPLILGLMLDRIGGYAPIFGLMAFLSVLAALIYAFGFRAKADL